MVNSYLGALTGKLGVNIRMSKPNALAASMAHVSTPLQPPDIIIGLDDLMDSINDDIESLSNLRLDPITANLTEDTIKPNGNFVNRLRHHKRCFMNCFSVKLKQQIDVESLKEWKNKPSTNTTKVIGDILIPYITQYYDLITTAPPSKNREENNYCCFKLCEYISQKTGIPFIIAFRKRIKKYLHGRFESLHSELPCLLDTFVYSHKSILFIDDVITSGTTARTCYNELHKKQNHVDGLIYCEWS